MTESGKGGQEDEEEEDEEEYVLLDLNSISAHIHIPPNAPYVLSVLFLTSHLIFIRFFSFSFAQYKYHYSKASIVFCGDFTNGL